MKKELVSVIVPVYNAHSTLEKCVQSILNQSYSNFELVLVNDGSKDDSLEICRKFEQSEQRVKVIDIQNQGVSNARNTGIENSTGNFITFVDSDDYLEPEYLNDLLENHKQHFLTLCAYKVIAKNNTTLRFFDKKTKLELPKRQFVDLFIKELMNSPCNKIYDARIIKTNNLKFDTHFSLGEDLLFNLEYMKQIDLEGFVVINKPLYNYIVADKTSLSKNYKKDDIEIQTILFTKVIAFNEDFIHESSKIALIKDSYVYSLLYRFEGLYRMNPTKDTSRFIKIALKENPIINVVDVLKTSSNIKLRIKLFVVYWLGFDVYYKLFGYK